MFLKLDNDLRDALLEDLEQNIEDRNADHTLISQILDTCVETGRENNFEWCLPIQDQCVGGKYSHSSIFEQYQGKHAKQMNTNNGHYSIHSLYKLWNEETKHQSEFAYKRFCFFYIICIVFALQSDDNISQEYMETVNTIRHKYQDFDSSEFMRNKIQYALALLKAVFPYKNLYFGQNIRFMQNIGLQIMENSNVDDIKLIYAKVVSSMQIIETKSKLMLSLFSTLIQRENGFMNGLKMRATLIIKQRFMCDNCKNWVKINFKRHCSKTNDLLCPNCQNKQDNSLKCPEENVKDAILHYMFSEEYEKLWREVYEENEKQNAVIAEQKQTIQYKETLNRELMERIRKLTMANDAKIEENKQIYNLNDELKKSLNEMKKEYTIKKKECSTVQKHLNAKTNELNCMKDTKVELNTELNKQLQECQQEISHLKNLLQTKNEHAMNEKILGHEIHILEEKSKLPVDTIDTFILRDELKFAEDVYAQTRVDLQRFKLKSKKSQQHVETLKGESAQLKRHIAEIQQVRQQDFESYRRRQTSTWNALEELKNRFIHNMNQMQQNI